MKKRPNIFDYKPFKLSQDTFLPWLIQWADKDYREIDSPLNACAVSFVQELLGKDNSYKIKTIDDVINNWDGIDVCALVNNQYLLVIEEKRGLKEHSDLLNRYAEIAKNHYENQYENKYENSDIEIKLVCFKMEEEVTYSYIKDAGFSLFQRSKMLSILENYINSTQKLKQNDILVDYHKSLDNFNKRINSYLTKPLNEWHFHSWQGFYAELQKHIGGDWDCIPNAPGELLDCWWIRKKSGIDGDGYDYYLQLEQTKLVFKLHECKKNNSMEIIRDFYRDSLYKKADELNISISQYGRLRKVKWIELAKLNSEYRITNENGLLNIQATIDNLKSIMKLIDETEKKIKNHNNKTI